MTGHKRHPFSIDRNTWFYDSEGGIDIIHEIRDKDGRYIRTDHIRMRWQSVLAAAKRHLEELKK